MFFFFQAEDGIRDLTVTGVQTCALPIYPGYWAFELADSFDEMTRVGGNPYWREKLNIALHYLQDRKSTRLNSSHSQISYAVFCLKKQKELNELGRLRISMVAYKYSFS